MLRSLCKDSKEYISQMLWFIESFIKFETDTFCFRLLVEYRWFWMGNNIDEVHASKTQIARQCVVSNWNVFDRSGRVSTGKVVNKHYSTGKTYHWELSCFSWCMYDKTYSKLPSNFWYKSHQIPKRNCYSFRLAFAFALSIEARCLSR